MSYRSLIRFCVRPGMEKLFEEAFENAGMLKRAKQIGGFVEAELCRDVGDVTQYIVVGTWESEKAYANWQAVSRAEADPSALAVLDEVVVEPIPGRLFSSVSRASVRAP